MFFTGPRQVESPPPSVPLTLSEKLKDLTRPEMMRPLRLIVFYFFFYHCGGLTGLRPYMVNVFKEFRLTIDPYWLTVSLRKSHVLFDILYWVDVTDRSQADTQWERGSPLLENGLARAHIVLLPLHLCYSLSNYTHEHLKR